MTESLAATVLQLLQESETSASLPGEGRRPSPYTSTLRPIPFSPEVSATLVHIPQAPLVPHFPQPEPEEPEQAYVATPPQQVRYSLITCPVIRDFIFSAEGLDLCQDQAYMPFPCTTLKEAVRHLRVNGCLGVHGGHLQLKNGRVVLRSLRFHGNKRNFTLDYHSALALLKVNYPACYQCPSTQVA